MSSSALAPATSASCTAVSLAADGSAASFEQAPMNSASNGAAKSQLMVLRFILILPVISDFAKNHHTRLRLTDAVRPACARYGRTGSSGARPRTSDQFQ